MPTAYGLGRIVSPVDLRDRDYLMVDHAAILGATPASGSRVWDVPVLYDQGPSPHCVGYSWAGFMSSTEYLGSKKSLKFDADGIYAYANQHDGIPGKHDGSTVRSGANTLVSVGAKAVTDGETDYIQPNYYWADLSRPDYLDQIAAWILTVSPVVLGLKWYNAMFQPGPDGFVSPDNGVAGGHAILCRGVDTAKQVFTLRNSWGKWGFNNSGDCYVSYSDMVTLLTDGGEACAAVDASGAPTSLPVHKHHWWDFLLDR